MDNHAAMMDLMTHDPDGWATQPTDADYAAFRAWAIQKYGADAWKTYNMDMWGTVNDI